MEWKEYWNNLIIEKKLQNMVHSMDEIDQMEFGQYKIEDICRSIFMEYEDYRRELENVRKNLLEIIDTFPGVHLQTSRVKSLDSLLEKVVTKRYKHLRDKDNLYSTLNGNNYKEILTDLIGMRLIINYRGNWLDLHNTIIEKFPYAKDKSTYKPNRFLPHLSTGEGMIAEIPVAYYAYDDDISIYESVGIRTVLRENGYRSVHYVISFQNTYIEIQVRTIYQEAWCDCDHLYVYKHEENGSHTALLELSKILCDLTGVANDLGDSMGYIFEGELLKEKGEYYQSSGDVQLQIQNIFARIEDTQRQLGDFMKHVRGDNYEKSEENRN